MEVLIKSTKRRVKKKVVRDHYWYDSETQQRLHGKGGRMIFVYDRVRKKTVPRIIDSEEWVYEDSYSDIERWTQSTGVEVVDKAPGHYILINISVAEWPDIETDLYRHRFMYDYEEDQMRQESSDKKERKRWQNSPSKWQIRPPR